MNQVRNKEDVIQYVRETVGITKAQASKAVEAFLGYIKSECADGNKIRLIGEITAEPARRAARKGRNPQTGEEIDIAAKNYIKISTGSNFDRAVADCNFNHL